MEEKWFFLYQLKMDPLVAMKWPIPERKWYMERFVIQKEKEHEAIEAAKRKNS